VKGVVKVFKYVKPMETLKGGGIETSKIGVIETSKGGGNIDIKG